LENGVTEKPADAEGKLCRSRPPSHRYQGIGSASKMIVAAMRKEEHPCHGASAGRMGGGTDTDIAALHATAPLDSLVGRNTAYSRISSVSNAAFAGSAAPCRTVQPQQAQNLAVGCPRRFHDPTIGHLCPLFTTRIPGKESHRSRCIKFTSCDMVGPLLFVSAKLS
jgi:hypothetical protein